MRPHQSHRFQPRLDEGLCGVNLRHIKGRGHILTVPPSSNRQIRNPNTEIRSKPEGPNDRNNGYFGRRFEP
jgi:hypothetical protein